MQVKQKYSTVVSAIVVGGIATSLSTVALADPTVQVYGRLSTGVDNYSATGATAGAAGEIGKVTRVFDSLSRLGFRGTERISNDLSVVFQIETGFNVDNGGSTTQGGAPNASTGGIGSRTTFVGLSSKSFGSLRFGRQDAYWITYPHAQTALSFTHMGPEYLVDAPTGLVSIPMARQNNTVQYISPVFNGFSTQLNYSLGTEAVASPRDRAYAVKLSYDNGPYSVSYDYGIYENAPVGGVPRAGFDKIGHRLAGSYAYAPGSRFGVLVSRLENNNVAAMAAIAGGFGGIAAGDNLSTTSIALNWEHTIGDYQLFGGYGRTGNVKNSSGLSDTQSKIFTLGARYNFSKRTGVYVDYGRISNDRNAFLDFTIGGITHAPRGALTTANAGADPRVFGVGLMHNF